MAQTLKTQNIIRKKILYINGNLLPINAGDSIYSAGVIMRLALKYDILLLTFGNDQLWKESILNKIKNIEIEFINKDKSLLNKLYKIILLGSIKQIYSKDYVKKLQAIISANKFDYVIMDHLRTYSVYKKVRKHLDSHTQTIYTAHNQEYQNFIEKKQLTRGFKDKLVFSFIDWKLKRIEQKALNSCDRLWALSEEDLTSFEKNVSKEIERIVIPPYFEFQQIKPDINRKTKQLLILGSMDWYPNIEGTLHFVNEIFPKLIEIDPEYTLFIVGRDPVKEIQDLNNERITVTGSVNVIDDYLIESDLLVLPNRLGSGIKVKVMESLMKGLPVVMYKENVNGYATDIFTAPFVVNNTQEFINSIIYLTNNKTVCRDFIINTNNYFRNNLQYNFNL